MKRSILNPKHLQKQGIWLLLILLALACAVVLTVVTEQLEERLHWHWDLTKNRVYSIGDTTRQILQELDRDIVVYTVYPQGEEDRTITELLRRYELASSRVTVQNIDPIRTPLYTQRFEQDGQPVENNAIIVAFPGVDGDFRLIRPSSLYEWQLEGEQLYATGTVAEQRITSAITSLLGGPQPTVYFVTGHGEMSLNALYYLQGVLENDEYQVASYHLIYNDAHLGAEDCLVFMSPVQDLSEEECQVLESFLAGSGKVLFFLSPLSPQLPRFERVLAAVGLSPRSDLVVEADPDRYFGNPVILRPRVQDHAVTQMLLDAGADTVMSRCRSVGIAQADGLEITPLFITSGSSYGKVNPLTETLDREPGDTDGPFVLAAASHNMNTGAKVALYGSTDFISSLDNAKFAGNLTAFMGGVSWAAGKGASVVIQPKSLIDPPLQVTSARQSYLLTAFVIGVMPALVLAAGALVWTRRMRR